MKKFRKRSLVSVMIMGCTLMFAACEEEDNEPQNDNDAPLEEVVQIRLDEDDESGPYLTNEDGRTMYYFSDDVSGQSLCSGDCEENWPVVGFENPKVGEGLEESDFGTITREDGSKQTTYKGWPLYYYIGDDQAGKTNGEGVGKVWYIAKPDYTFMIGARKKANGERDLYLVDAEGNSLYYFLQDPENESVCEGACVENWPLFASDEVVVPSYLESETFGEISRNDGESQLTFKGRPVYYFKGDAKRGETKGDQVNEVWFLFNTSILEEEW